MKHLFNSSKGYSHNGDEFVVGFESFVLLCILHVSFDLFQRLTHLIYVSLNILICNCFTTQSYMIDSYNTLLLCLPVCMHGLATTNSNNRLRTSFDKLNTGSAKKSNFTTLVVTSLLTGQTSAHPVTQTKVSSDPNH